MTNLSSNQVPEEVLSYLEEQFSKAQERYNLAKEELRSAERDFSRFKTALDAITGKDIVSVSEIYISNNEEKTSNSHHEDNAREKNEPTKRDIVVYNATWSYSEKSVFAIKTRGYVLGRREIAEFILEQEPSLNLEKLELTISGELHKLKAKGIIGAGVPEGVRMKGFLYGHPDWFNARGYVKPEYISKKIVKKQSLLW